MLLKTWTVFFLFVIVSFELTAQTPRACSVLGQTPQTAFPLCTKDTFAQTTVPICTNRRMLVPGCEASNSDYADKNPFWYKFTCYQTGTLGLLITPNNLDDDYDWQLYDVTGVTDLGAVYTNASLFVVANWSGSSGLTGTGPTGTHRVECGSDPAQNINTFSAMPTLINGHNYLLMISHYSDNQSGYKLSFGGGNAVINDPKMPDLAGVQPSCDGTTLTLKLDTKMKCSSIAVDGSDFRISPAGGATVMSATGNGCNSGFDSDSITIVLSNALPAGNYALELKKGIDVNTLLDDCDREIPENRQLSFVIAPPTPTFPDSIKTLKCAPASIDIVFPKHIRCNSIAADGSDFIITGPAPLTISSAAGDCSNGLTSTITIKLASPVVVGGVYQVSIKQGSDFNNIIDECGQETPVGASVNFSVKDTVSADFDYKEFYGCAADTVIFSHNGSHGVNQWLWQFDSEGLGVNQSETVIFKVFGKKQVLLKVSNGFCSDSMTKTISLDNAIDAAFETNDILCPEDAAVFKNNSTGALTDYNWSFGDGGTSTLQTPGPRNYPKIGGEKKYTVQLIVHNQALCADTAVATIKVLRSCYIAVPNAFTPNNDGLNDYLYPLNAFKADNMEFHVYNRLGQLVFHSTDWTQKWDGSINGNPQTSGVYVWTLRYTNHDTAKPVSLKGSSVLIR